MSTTDDAASDQDAPHGRTAPDEEGGTAEAVPQRPLVPPEHVPAVSAEALVDGEHSEGEGVQERRYPSTIGGAFYLVVLVVVLVGMGLVVAGEWRTGIRTFGGALVFGAAVRLVLKPEDAGMLAVRNKPFDAGVLVLLGALMIFLAGSIPDQL